MTITHKDKYLIMSALRRAFARSDRRREAASRNYIEHQDPKHPRCQYWSWCTACGEVVPRHTTAVDHVEPVVPTDMRMEDMSAVEMVERVWLCPLDGLQVLCKFCHAQKTLAENRLRPKRGKKRHS